MHGRNGDGNWRDGADRGGGMARRKITPFRPWETKNSNGVEKRYFRMGATIMASESMKSLSPSAFKVYCYMRIESAGKKTFTFPHSKYQSYMSKPTFFKAVGDLEVAGFIDVVQHNGNLRKPNVYSFSDRWTRL